MSTLRSKPVERTAAATGVSITTIKAVSSAESLDAYPTSEVRKRTKTGPKVPRCYDGHLRALVFAMAAAKEPVTLDSILAKARQEWATTLHPVCFGRTTLYKLMGRARLHFARRKTHHEAVKEEAFIAAQRTTYIKQVREWRSKGYTIFYLDESCLTKNMSTKMQWQSETGEGSYASPQGKGERIIISDLGSSRVGFLPGAELIFLGRASTINQDYHGEMNADIFEQWLEEDVLWRISQASPHGCGVLVLDRAPYHRRITDETKRATKSMKKSELIAHLLRHKHPLDAYTEEGLRALTRDVLFTLCEERQPRPRFKVEELAEVYGIKILFLPVAHPELNPIELMWAQMKQQVRKYNVTFKTEDVVALARSTRLRLNADSWKGAEAHCIKYEDLYMQNEMDEHIELMETQLEVLEESNEFDEIVRDDDVLLEDSDLDP
jgi:hypothetical protein